MSLFQVFARFKQSIIERRRSIREQVQFPAWIDIGDGSQPCRCNVLDVSEGGARIMVSAQHDLPKQFWLVLTEDRTKRRHCRLAWRSGAQVGVAYLGAIQHDFFPPDIAPAV
jgi:PilZ domain